MVSPYYHGVEWPPHVHREYPKWVNPAGTTEEKDRVQVQDAEQEAEITGVAPGTVVAQVPPDVVELEAKIAELRRQLAERDAPPVEEPAIDPETDERRALMARAEALGIGVDRRWGVERLRSAVDAA